MKAFLYILTVLLTLKAHGLQNVTVDDADPRVAYHGIWNGDQYQQASPPSLDYGGSHTVSLDPSANAVFTFPGQLDFCVFIDRVS